MSFFALRLKCQKERPAITRLIPAEKWHRMMANLSRKALGKKRSRNMIRPRREKQIVLVRRAINPWIEWNTDLQLSKCIIRTQKQNIKPVNRLVYHRQAQGTVRGYKVNHLAINSITAVTGKDGFTLASAAIAVVEFMAKWSNVCPPTVKLSSLFPKHLQ